MKREKKIYEIKYIALLTIEAIIIVLLFSIFIKSINGGIGNPNVTVATYLNVGEVAPEIFNVSIDNDNATVGLIPNSTKIVSCVGLIRDYNNETDIANVTAEFYASTSSYGAVDDGNNHYTNGTCYENISFGTWKGVTDDNYTILGQCTFLVQYYADPVPWNCTMFVNDTAGWNATGNDTINMSELLAIELPATINYGTVNSTYVSNENITNISNAGNVRLNLTLKGWARTQGDNLSMNCSLGNIRNISIMHEKFNLSNSNPGDLTLAQVTINYTNLTSNAINKSFNLNYRQEDSYNDAINASYWRIYVPLGVAGSCQGNIQFGATRAVGT